MDYGLNYTQRALNDLEEIISYIAEDNPDAATRFGNSLLDHLALLQRYPRIGTIARKRAGVRKLTHSPIVVYYQIKEREHLIHILHFRHGSRKEPRF